MRQLADADHIRQFMQALGAEGNEKARLYFTGGATAVLLGWRPTTIDVDIRLFPETDRLLRAVPRLKEQLQLNIELACPADFIPELRGWQDRSLSIAIEGQVAFYHYDLYAQALAKIERGLIDLQTARRHFDEMEPLLYRYPAIHPPAFRRAAEEILAK